MRQLEFRCSEPMFIKYKGFLDMLGETEDFSDDFYALIEEIKSLPGFPRGVDVNTRVSVCITGVQV